MLFVKSYRHMAKNPNARLKTKIASTAQESLLYEKSNFVVGPQKDID